MKAILMFSIKLFQLSFIALTLLLTASMAHAGTNCGSSASSGGKLYKGATSDWWPDLVTSLAVDIVVPSGLFSAAFCAATQGQAYFGDGCAWHDDCYDGKIGLGMTREECDAVLHDQWRQSCQDKYEPANSLDFGQKFCQDYCKNTADGMYDILSASSKDSWDAAKEGREKNIATAIDAIYTDIYGRPATPEEISASNTYLSTTKSVEGLKEKVKQDYLKWSTQILPASISAIVNLLLESDDAAPVVMQKLTVQKSGTAPGSVMSSPDGITCGNTCTTDFKQNTAVSLTANPEANSVFAGWSGACSGTQTTCTVSMDSAKNVTAKFDKASVPTQKLTISKAGAAAGKVTSSPEGITCGNVCNFSFNQNASVTLSATADSAAVFSGWSGACSGKQNTCTVTMDSAKTVTASFEELLSVKDWERIMNWAQAAYPDLFSQHNKQDLTIPPYNVRYYPDSLTYLGYNPNDDRFYGYNAAVWGANVVKFGPVADYINQAEQSGF